MFASLPSGFEQLEQAINDLKIVRVLTPPPFRDLGEQLRIVYENDKNHDYENLTQSEWRHLPYSLWVSNQKDLIDIHPKLIVNYKKKLQEILEGQPRRIKRWLLPLFFVYCTDFDKSNKNFKEFSLYVQDLVARVKTPEGYKLSELQRQYDFFSPLLVGTNLAHLFFNTEKPLDFLIKENMLWSGFENTNLGIEVFKTGLNQSEEVLRQANVSERFMNWEERMHTRVVKTDLRVLFADSLLGVWAKNKRIEEPLKSNLLDFFIENYGDPRSINKANYQWEGVSQASIQMMRYLLAGDTLKSFMSVLKNTADDIWQYRQKFWMAYYEAGYIEEAWLVLGSEAREVAKRMYIPRNSYADLAGIILANQSVLLLRIGNLIFSEWSHNGSLRAFAVDDANAPALYSSLYYGEELRAKISLDFHSGENKRPELVHANSISGTWQKKARDLIHKHTNIYLSNKEILL